MEKAREKIDQDFMEAPAETYNAEGMDEEVNKVIKSGEPLRKKYTKEQEDKIMADKEAYIKMLINRKQGK